VTWAVRGGLSAAEVLGRTQGSVGRGAFYAVFVLLVAIHAGIALRNVLDEWAPTRNWSGAMGLAAGALLLALGWRAVAAVTLGGGYAPQWPPRPHACQLAGFCRAPHFRAAVAGVPARALLDIGPGASGRGGAGRRIALVRRAHFQVRRMGAGAVPGAASGGWGALAVDRVCAVAGLAARMDRGRHAGFAGGVCAFCLQHAGLNDARDRLCAGGRRRARTVHKGAQAAA